MRTRARAACRPGSATHPRGRTSQRPPPGDWRVWAYVAGRGAGKTRAGACSDSAQGRRRHELACWQCAESRWDLAMLALRAGVDPQVLITATPRRQAVLKARESALTSRYRLRTRSPVIPHRQTAMETAMVGCGRQLIAWHSHSYPMWTAGRIGEVRSLAHWPSLACGLSPEGRNSRLLWRAARMIPRCSTSFSLSSCRACTHGDDGGRDGDGT